jgi:hypothetical protein
MRNEITLPKGKILGLSPTKFLLYIEDKFGGQFESKESAFEAYTTKFPDDGDMCLNCGS